MNNLYLTPEEDQYYRQLWSIIDPQGFGSANARETVAFFKKSLLPPDKLKSIWLMSVQNQENKLYQQEFNTIMKLIAYGQNGFELSPQLLIDNPTVRLPVMDGVPYPQLAPPQQQQAQPKTVPLAQSYQTVPVQSQQMSQQSFKPPLVQQALQDNNSQFEIGKDLLDKYSQHYQLQDKTNQGFIDGQTARGIFQKSQLSPQILAELWALVDTGHKGFLYKFEYIVAIHLISLCRRNIPLPPVLPECMAKLITPSQPPTSIIINGIKPEEQNQPQLGRMQSGQSPQLNNEIQQLTQQQQQLQSQLFQMVMQFQNNSNNNYLKQLLQQKQNDLDFFSKQVNKFQEIFDSLKSQELELTNELQKIKSSQQNQKPNQLQMNLPIQTQQQLPYQQPQQYIQQLNVNPVNVQQNQNIGYGNFPPLDSQIHKQVDYHLDDGYSSQPW